MQERIQDFDAVNLLQSTVPEASPSFEEALALGKRRVRMGRMSWKEGRTKGRRKGRKKGRRKKESSFSEGLKMIWVLRVHISTLLWELLLSPIKLCLEE